jgi:hypothetical protein
MAFPSLWDIYSRTPNTIINMLERTLQDYIETAPAMFADINTLRSMIQQAKTLSAYTAPVPNPEHPNAQCATAPLSFGQSKAKADAARANREAREAEIRHAAFGPVVHVWRNASSGAVCSELVVRVSETQLRKHCPEAADCILLSVAATVRPDGTSAVQSGAVFTAVDTPSARNPADQRKAAVSIYNRRNPAPSRPAPVAVARKSPPLAPIPEADDDVIGMDDDSDDDDADTIVIDDTDDSPVAKRPAKERPGVWV